MISEQGFCCEFQNKPVNNRIVLTQTTKAMKKVLGLDIGVSSIGVAIIEEIEEKSNIKELAVRVVPEDVNFHGKFYSGNTASKNLERTLNRGIRRNNQRFKQRRDRLVKTLDQNGMLPSDDLMTLDALPLYALRAKSVSEKIGLKELGRVLLLINQRRGFLSNRKADTEESTSDYKDRIAQLETDLDGGTIGQRLFQELSSAASPMDIVIRERTYLRSSYLFEFDKIWEEQSKHHAILTGGPFDERKKSLYHQIRNRIIFYQRPLKSQKGLVSDCAFEQHHKSIAKSSPYFEVFRIWQRINDLTITLPNGQGREITQQQKNSLFDSLFYGHKLNKKLKLTATEIRKILGLKAREGYLNFTELDGAKTYAQLHMALKDAGVTDPEKLLTFDLTQHDPKGGLLELWHITYSLTSHEVISKTLQKRFGFTPEQSDYIAQKVNYSPDYGSLSTRAIRKLIPHLEKGLQYSDACDQVGYDHSGYKTTIELIDKLRPIRANSLRNPVVEQILNQVVNVVNTAIEKHGKFDEIRVELARELRNSAKIRQKIEKGNTDNKKRNDQVRNTLKSEFGFGLVNGRDVKRFKLFEETKRRCLYCGQHISGTELTKGIAEIEHILPKSRSFNNSMANFILAHRKCNQAKGPMTAYDYMASQGDEKLDQYVQSVNALYADGKGTINKAKFDHLLTKGKDIPADFVSRMLKDTQYITKETVKMLKTVCANTYTTTGQITDFLRKEWELNNTMQDLMIDVYRQIGQTERKEYKDSQGNVKSYEKIKNWSKRDDHRHHAVDALVCALTNPKIIFKLNNLNKIFQLHRNELSPAEIQGFEELTDGKFDLKEFADHRGDAVKLPIPDLRDQLKQHLEGILVSYKKDNSKILTKNTNTYTNGGAPQQTWVPRASLHKDTMMGRVKIIAEKPLKLNPKVVPADLDLIQHPGMKDAVMAHLDEFDGNIATALSTKTLKKTPIQYRGAYLKEVPVYEYVHTKRVKVTEGLTAAMIDKILDKDTQRKVQERIAAHSSIKEAFKNYSQNPIVLSNGTQLKSLTVIDKSKTIQVREGYALTGGNHHALIYKDEEGKYQPKVITNWDAVGIGLANVLEMGKPYPIISRKDDQEFGVFHFSLQRNDFFVLDLKHSPNPTEEHEVDFLDPKNRPLISKKLFRVQSFTLKTTGVFNITFRHHLETSVDKRNSLDLKETTWFTFSKMSDFERLTKLKIDHLGDIKKIGE